MTNPTFILPSSPGIAASNLYALKVGNQPERFSPISGAFARSTTASRQNANGLIESIGINTPRLDYTYGSCPALLLEPQRTNLMLYSEQLDNSNWVKADTSVTANTTTSPDGTTNADSLIENTATALHQISQGTVSVGGVYTVSIYAKKNGRNWIFLNIASASNYGAWFDIDSGVLGTVQANITNTTITNVGNGWYRCSVTANTGALSPRLSLTMATANNVLSYTGNGTSGIFIYGAQVEQGSYPTTYIPTTSATVTRTADSFSYSNIFTNGYVSSQGGTWLIELKNNVSYTRDTGSRLLELNDGGTPINSITIRNQGGTTRLAISKYIAGVETFLYNTVSDSTRLAIKWNGSTLDIFSNGSKVVSLSSFSTTNMVNLLGYGVGVPVFVQSMALFNTPLSDAECVLLTSDTYGTFATLASSTSYTLS